MAALPLPLRKLMLDFSAAVGCSPTAESFLVLGWILCNGRRTLSAVIRAAGPEARKSHDAYQNFFSKAKWSMEPLWKMLFLLLVKVLVTRRAESEEFSVGTLWLAGDDTLSKHYGRKIWGAGLYRDAVRSSKKHTAYAWGLNWVVLAMVAKVPLLKERFIALPLYARLNPKTATTESDATPRRGRRRRGPAKERQVGVAHPMRCGALCVAAQANERPRAPSKERPTLALSERHGEPAGKALEDP